MNAPGLVRLRWRLRGAWLWPSFIVLTFGDAIVGHLLPPAGDTQSLAGAWLVGLWAMLIAVIVLAPAVGLLIRRRRVDMPRVVARNYGGTVAIFAVSAALLAAGLIHHSSLLAGRRALQVADSRARSWIAVNGPVAFRHDLETLDTYAIQPLSIYRACVFDLGGRTYCVVVRDRAPRARSVSFAGYEPNSVLAAGAN
jgi:hypothetical protein